MVYGKYKQIKRELALIEQQRRLNWFRSIVYAKKFARMLLEKARTKLEQQRMKEQHRLSQMESNRISRQQTTSGRNNTHASRRSNDGNSLRNHSQSMDYDEEQDFSVG